MACFVKLKPDCYLLWNKAADAPAEHKLYTEAEVYQELQKQNEVLSLMSPPPVMSPEAILTWLETYGTSDLGKSVTSDFIEKYNSLGPQGQPLTIAEIIKLLTKN